MLPLCRCCLLSAAQAVPQVSRLKREVSPEQLQTLYSACGRLPALVATGAQDGIVPRAQVLRKKYIKKLQCSRGMQCFRLPRPCWASRRVFNISELVAVQAGAVAADLGASRTPETGAVHMACIPQCGHLSHEEAPEALLQHLTAFADQAIFPYRQQQSQLSYSGG